MSTTRDDRAPALHIAGDSTAAPKGIAAAPETGWGMALPFYLPGTEVVNHARNGRSSSSFISLGHLEQVDASLREGDLLLVQFGHNDAKVEDPVRHTEPWTTYQESLTVHLEVARRRGARPVLATSVERRSFDAAGRAVTSHGEYPAAMRELARRAGVPLVDVQASSLALWQELGPDETRRYFLHAPDGRRDDTHLSPLGAGAVARLVASGLVEVGVLTPDAVARLDEDVPAERLTWADVDPNA
ncbi:rhamnogalacturonan acetylesterase [Cellulosimicrobium sp. PMB13]|uniref:rhamnogalacturonan acetylesterase n=1 Tax=Cellulosimicrobium sp. PMB13 TaxID=3120158 RepID=UPI003F4C0B30